MQGPAETTESVDRLLEELRKLAMERNLERLENVWMEAVENPAQVGPRLDSFLDVTEGLVRSQKDLPRTGSMLELLLAAVSEHTPATVTLRLYGLLVRCFPAKKDYRAGFVERFERMYPLASAERVFYEASGFVSSTSPAGALARLDRLLKFREGAYVFHASGWGVGKVLAVDPFLRQVKVDLEHKRDHRIAIDAVDSILEPLPSDSFLVLSHLGGGALKRIADEDPVRVVGMVLETFGTPLALKDVKSRLIPAAVEAASWNKWWNRAKGLLRDTGLFRVGDRAPYTVERLEKAVSYEQELVHNFGRYDWPQARQIARQVARRTGNELEGAWLKIRERLLTLVDGNSATNAIEAGLILDRGDAGGAKEQLQKVFGRLKPQDLVAALQDLPGVDEQRRAVESLPDARPTDWQAISALCFGGKKDTLRDAALELLEKREPVKIQAIVRDLVKSPKSAPEAFCFILQLQMEGSSHPSLEVLRGKTPREHLVLVMDLLDHLQHQAERLGRTAFKESLRRIEDILGEGSQRFFIAGAKPMGPEELRELYARLVRNESIAPQLKGALLQCLLDIDPTIGHDKELPPWEEPVVYATNEGHERKKDEFREIMDIKLPKVFEDIGRAAAFGDLSENAEYTSALEERDNLTKRATKMKSELDRVRLIVPDMAKSGFSGLGSRVRVRNLRTGDETVYSILGPWDGSPEQGVLNYLSPLGRLFHGKKEGDEVEAQLPGGVESFKILEIGSHFASK